MPSIERPERQLHDLISEMEKLLLEARNVNKSTQEKVNSLSSQREQAKKEIEGLKVMVTKLEEEIVKQEKENRELDIPSRDAEISARDDEIRRLGRVED